MILALRRHLPRAGHGSIVRISGNVGALIAVFLFTGLVPVLGAAVVASGDSFIETWNRTDLPVANGAVSRTWIWGDQLTAVVTEDYAEAPGGIRQVQYFDKSRMEINDPDGDRESPWYVTNGLLVVELITGRMQVGDDDFNDFPPSEANVAGDQDIGSTVEYHYLARYLDAPARTEGELIVESIGSLGALHRDDRLAELGATAGYYDPVTRHTIATPFWEFMTSVGTVWDGSGYTTAPLFEHPYFATGHPITEAYWTNTTVAGTHRTVLFQCFERRCLTYTPDNPPGWQVEAGNVGQHYLEWHTEMLGRVGDGGYAYSGTVTEDGFATGAATIPQRPGQVAIADDGTMFLIDAGTQELLIYGPSGELVARRGFEPYGRPQAITLDAEDTVLLYTSAGGFHRIDTAGNLLAQFAEEPGVVPGTKALAGGFDVDEFGNFYYADVQNNLVLVRKFNARGDLIGLIEAPTFDAPNGVAVAPDGKLYVSTYQSNILLTFLPTGAYAGTFEADGCVVVTYVSVDREGNVLSACEDAVLKQAPDGSRLAVWGGPGDAEGRFAGIAGIAVDREGRIYVSDAGNERVQVFDGGGVYLYSLPAPPQRVIEAANVDVDASGRMVVSGDFYSSFAAVRVLDSEGQVLHEWTPVAGGYATDVALGVDDAVYLLYQDAVGVYALDGTHLSSLALVPGEHVRGELWAIDVDAAGNVYMLDSGLIRRDEANVPSAIVKYGPDGGFIARWETVRSAFGADVNYYDMALDGASLFIATYEGLKRLDAASGAVLEHWPDATGMHVDVDASGNVYLGRGPDYGDIYRPWIRKFAPDGAELAAWGVTGPGEGRINDNMSALAVAPDGIVYAIDYRRVQRFSTE